MFGGFLLLLNAVAFAAFTWPALTRARRAEGRSSDVAVQRAGLESLWSQLVARRDLVEQNRKDIETLKTDYLKFRASDLFAAQRDIEKLATDAGLRPRRSTYAIEKVKGTDLVRCTVNLPLDGSYSNLTEFLTRVETAKRFIVVDEMQLSQDEQGAKMNLRLSAIFKEADTREAQ
jgi:hypothetical protein